jgi:hexosaminidase
MGWYAKVSSRAVLLSVASSLILSAATLGAQTQLPNLPLPEHVTPGSGSLVMDQGLKISFEGFTEPRLDRARGRFIMQLSRETGILHWPEPTATQPRFVIQTAHASDAVESLGEDESYHLEVTPERIILRAPNPLGVLHGLQTFLQMVELTDHGFVVPSVTIDDKPRFPWRGVMIDTGRHFIPLNVLRQNIDLMEASKLNVFHWHLSEDQGFRIESKIYPLLQGKGSDGLYYTQDQARELIAYARDRGIRVVPEFDMPAHAASWFVGYPELASGTGPYSIIRKWGIFDPAMDPTRESTYQFLDRFLGEMTAIFPDAYFHIGGDECNGKEWDANPRIQKFMHEHQLKGDVELQAYFTSRVEKLVTKYHKIAVGWDEVLQPDTPRDVVIQSWRGQESLAVAARQGNRGILSWGYYLDLNQSASQHYGIDPLAGAAVDLTPEQQKLILGGESAMWSEFMTPEIISGRIWPRAAAVAERLWSPQNVTDTESMYRRLAIFSQRMPWYGLPSGEVNRALLQRMIGNADPSSLLVLASVVEPPKEYTRESLATYGSYTPLNKLVDAVPAESQTAREFNELAARIATGNASAADFAQARRWLTVWRDNDAVLQPLLAGSSLTQELAPMSLNLKQTETIGLDALSSLEDHKPVSSTVQEHQLTELKKLKAPQAVLLDAIVPGVEQLVQASSH